MFSYFINYLAIEKMDTNEDTEKKTAAKDLIKAMIKIQVYWNSTNFKEMLQLFEVVYFSPQYLMR